MVSLLVVASLTTILTTGSGAESSRDQLVREAANSEFIAEHYPSGALKRGEQGKVTFQLTVEPDGSIGACDVTGSSGFAGLDQETCEIMVRYARTKPVRNADGRAVRTTSPGHIVWKLPDGNAKVANVSSGATKKPDKLICKRVHDTGSLIARTKQCLSRSEWTRQERVTRDAVDRIQGRGVVDCKSTGAC